MSGCCDPVNAVPPPHPRRETRPSSPLFQKGSRVQRLGFRRPATVTSEHLANVVFTRRKSIASNWVVYDPGCTSHVCQPAFPRGFGRACAETNHGVAAALGETELCQLREEMLRFPPFNRCGCRALWSAAAKSSKRSCWNGIAESKRLTLKTQKVTFTLHYVVFLKGSNSEKLIFFFINKRKLNSHKIAIVHCKFDQYGFYFAETCNGNAATDVLVNS